MATDFTQDTLLHFLQSSGGSVKNSDLLLHFRNFIRDHADRNRNRELFKKFVNTVATVKQVDGVSYVVLRKKFKGSEWGSSEPSKLPAGKNSVPRPENAKLSPAGSTEGPRQKPQLREVTAPAPPGVTAAKTILPVAGLVLNNNNTADTHLNIKQKPQQLISTPELPGRAAAAAAQLVNLISEKTEVKTTRAWSEPPAQHQRPEVGQHKVRFGPEITPAVPAATHHGRSSQQVPGAVGGLHQEPPLHHNTLLPQSAPCHIRHRRSYKSAISHDEDEEEEEEVAQMRIGSAGGAWPLSTPLRDMGGVLSASTPCIIDPPAPPSVSSSSSYSSETKLPKITVQDVEGETPPGGWSLQSGVEQRRQWAVSGLKPGSVSGETSSTRRSLPLETGYTASPDQATEAVPRRDVHAHRRYSHLADVHLGPNQIQGVWLSSSHSSTFSPSSDAGFSSSNLPLSRSPRGSGWSSSYEDLQAKAGETGGGSKIQEVLQRSQGKTLESVTQRATSKTTGPWHSTGHLHDNQEPTARLSPFHHSTDHLHDDQNSTARVKPWHLSTGDLYDDREEAESSGGSASLQLCPTVARRLSSQLRSRMSRSLGADLDQLLQEEVRVGGGSEAARLNRLHMISSSLSLRYNLSASSLSSCSTPPSAHSLADLVEVRGGRRSSSAATPCSTDDREGPIRQSLVPLEPREHAWLVKGAAGAWPDIYTLFREDSSLLNRHDFVSGFTVLHWIAKHGDHRVLNTLWYGVQKAGLTFDMNAKSTCGHTPLHIAAMHGNKNIMRLLVSKFNADVKLRDTAGKKPWHYLSGTTPQEVFQLLGAPSQPAGGEKGGVERESPNLQQQHRRRKRHHLSFASSKDRPLTMSGTMRVKRSSSIAAFLKHKSLHRFHGHQSDSSV